MSYEQAKALMLQSVSRPTLYSVRMPPSFTGGVDNFTNAYLQFYCKSTSLPESRFETTTLLGHENMGVGREQPTSVIFSKPITLEIIENSNFSIYKQFRLWYQRVAFNANPIPFTNTRTQRMRYYNTYTSDMYMSKLELPNNYDKLEFFDGDLVNAGFQEVIRFTFTNAYPIRIGDVRLDSSATDTYSTFTVDLTYETYSIGGELGLLDTDLDDFERQRVVRIP